MVSLAGSVWAFFNGGFVIMLSFVPSYLIGVGHPAATAGQLVSILTWVALVAVPLGGIMSDRMRRPALIVIGGSLIWAGGMMLIEPWSGSVLALAILFLVTSMAAAPPSGQLVSLPAEVLAPAHRAAGMGLFYSWFYLGVTLAPVLAGAGIEATGDPAAPITLAAILVLLALGCFLTFRFLRAR
jgi:predicted MFS family arabinose efflux permease